MAKNKSGGLFNVYIEDLETEERVKYSITAESPEQASQAARNKYGKPCKVRKCKLDRS